MTTKGRRGFAIMDPEKQRSIASMGGLAVDRHDRSFSQDKELAREAGRKGGLTRAMRAGQKIGPKPKKPKPIPYVFQDRDKRDLPRRSQKGTLDYRLEPKEPYIHNA